MITIPLTQGYETFIDDADADLAVHSWRIHNAKRHPVAVRNSSRTNGERHTLTMHRVILERILGRSLQSNEYTDHKDCNPLNNCRSNLRIATVTENNRNRKRNKNNKSGYKGVVAHGDRWQAYIFTNRKFRYLGTFDTPESAHDAYCIAATALFGEFANFGAV